MEDLTTDQDSHSSSSVFEKSSHIFHCFYSLPAAALGGGGVVFLYLMDRMGFKLKWRSWINIAFPLSDSLRT